MIVRFRGVYVLTEDFLVRSANSIAVLSKGAEIIVTQVDMKVQKVIGPQLLNWTYWELTVMRKGESEEDAERRELSNLCLALSGRVATIARLISTLGEPVKNKVCTVGSDWLGVSAKAVEDLKDSADDLEGLISNIQVYLGGNKNETS